MYLDELQEAWWRVGAAKTPLPNGPTLPGNGGLKVRFLVNFLFSALMNSRTRGVQAEGEHRQVEAGCKGDFFYN